MEKTVKSKIRIIFLVLPLLLTAMIFCSLLYADNGGGTDYFGCYTFERELALPDGKVAKFFESGDQYFHYYHDAEGFVLVKKDGELYYAQNENGRPMPSSQRYTAPLQGSFPKMLASEIDLLGNSDLLTEYPVGEDSRPQALLNNVEGQTKTIANIIIYIIFKDDTIDLTNNPLYSLLGGSGASLSDYFYTASDGGIIVQNHYPKNGSLVYVYRAPENRDYYNVEATSTRGKREAVLLTGAVNSAASRFDFGGASLDINSDGYVDSVAFIIGGSSSTTWGSLLWPHSWNLASINQAYNSSAHARIAGIEVGDYSFNFTTSVTLGVLCHEFFHVLGAPDLYHYNYDFVPVGDWDVMQFNKDNPQLPLTYMRTEYLGVPTTRVGTITQNGVYSLGPTVNAGEDKYFAYKIPTNVSGQYFMVEYRNNSVSPTYDSMLPGSGLIVYRVKEGVKEGNKNAKYQSTSYPDEVYVFRPRVASTGKETNNDTRYAVSKTDIAYAALSPESTYFSEVGKTLQSLPNASYDYETLFYVNGANSGIVIESISKTDGRIEFRVQLNNADSIASDYFDGKVSLTAAEFVNLSYAGASVNITAGNFELQYLKDIVVRLKTASGTVIAENKLNLSKFRTEYEQGERIFECPFVINDKGLPISSVFTAGDINLIGKPVFAELSVTDADNDSKVLQSIMVSDTYISWEAVLASRTELNASISASARITLGVRKDGTVQKSGGFSTGQWDVGGYNNIISTSAGLTHTLLLNTQRRVISKGTNDYGESNVSNWSDILIVEAGYKTSYAVNLQGRVFAVGDNNYGQLNVYNWTDIVAISAGARHVAGVNKQGNVVSTGSNSNGQCNTDEIIGAKAVACGNTFTACLLSDGRVTVAGELAGSDEVNNWTDIVKISAGENFIIGLKSDRTVVAAGVNESGQCSVEELQDIIDIAAGEYHAAFLREDGIVLFTGGSNESYNVDTGIGNLIYDNYIEVESISLGINKSTLYTGGKIDLSYAICAPTVLPAAATYKKVTYTSRDPSVATVSANGTVIAISPGVTVITARVNGSDISSEIEITVKKYIELASISFADASMTVVAGSSATLRLVYTPTDATVVGTAIYESSNTALATVNSQGVVTAGSDFGTVTITARLSNNGYTHITDCTVVIVSTVKEIQIISLPTKTVYSYNQDFDVGGGRIRITYLDNTASEQSVTMSMVSGYNKTVCGYQTITIAYLDATVSFDILVQNYVKDALVNSLGKTEYVYNESLNLSGITVLQKWADGSQTIIPLPGGAIASDYDKTKVGTQTVRLSFTLDGKVYETRYDVVVQDVVLYISDDAITKDSYIYGEELLGSENVIMHMASGAQRMVQLSETSISGYDSHVCGVHKVKAEYLDPVGGETHSFEKLVSVELAGEAKVYSIDSIGDRHLYLPTGYVYYTVGEALGIEVVYHLADGRQEVIGTDQTENIFYTLESFSNLNSGPGSTLIKVQYKVNKQVAGGGIVADYAALYLEINVYGSAELTITVAGETEYLYGETPEFVVYTVDGYGNPGGGAPDLVVYDSELTDAPQTCFVYYRNYVEQINIIIRDYIMYIEALADIETTYGAEIALDVYGYMAKAGTRLLESNEYEITGLNTAKLGISEVSVAAGGNTATFTLTVKDAILSMNVNTPIASTCLFGKQPDFSSTYNGIMASGATEVIEFSYPEFDVSYFDNRLMQTQTVKIVHKSTRIEFRFAVTVINYVQSISVAAGAKTDYRFGEQLSLGIIAAMANGETRNIALAECTVTGYDASRVDVEQTVAIAYSGVSTTLKVVVEDTVKSIVLERAPYKQNYKYGEALLLTGGRLGIVFSSGDRETLADSGLSSVACSYNPIAAGNQTVVFTIGTVSASFNVSVAARMADTYSLAKGSAFTQTEKSIVFDETMTLGELGAAVTVADYLKLRIKTADGKYITPNAAADKVIRSDYVLQIVNNAGFAVFSYKLYLKGDADCNGLSDESDISALADKLVSQGYDKDMTDYDGDGLFTLTDLINWARKLAEPKAPLNELAKTFVSDGRRKEEQIC